MPKKYFYNEIAFITARISIEMSNANTSIGTGFLYKAELDDGKDGYISLLISNKHVFIDPKGKISMEFNKTGADGNPDYGNVRTVGGNGFENAYYAHPDNDVDLACINVSEMTYEDLYYKCMDHEVLKEIDYDKIHPGSEITFVGYPENRYDKVNNLPLIRKGFIASVPEIDFNGKGQFVIDAQVFQGSSGSPVFVSIDNKAVLLGVVSETMIRNSKLQTLPSALPDVGVQQILGLGIVIKQRHVIELIEHAVSEFIKRNKKN